MPVGVMTLASLTRGLSADLMRLPFLLLFFRRLGVAIVNAMRCLVATICVRGRDF